MNENISPEEKLLRLIRNPAKSQPQERAGIKIPVRMPFQSPEKFSFMPNLIWVCFVLSCVYLIVVPYKQPQLPELQEAEPVKSKMDEPAIKPYDFYVDAVKKRPIFTVAQQEQRAQAAAGQDLTKDFVLMGIISGDVPQAVIENKKAQKTYYLNEGQFIDGFQVADIQEGKVILEYNGQKFELYL